MASGGVPQRLVSNWASIWNTPPQTNMTMEKSTIWRCVPLFIMVIFQPVMLVFRGVSFWNLKNGTWHREGGGLLEMTLMNCSGWWQLDDFFFHPSLWGKMNPFWLIFLKRGWNHQLVYLISSYFIPSNGSFNCRVILFLDGKSHQIELKSPLNLGRYVICEWIFDSCPFRWQHKLLPPSGFRWRSVEPGWSRKRFSLFQPKETEFMAGQPIPPPWRNPPTPGIRPY